MLQVQSNYYDLVILNIITITASLAFMGVYDKKINLRANAIPV